MAIEISLPFRIDGSGGVASTEDISEQVRHHTFSLVGTTQGERVMRGDYGTTLFEHLFESNNNTLEVLAHTDITQAVQQWLPEAQIRDVLVSQNQTTGRLDIQVLISVADGPEQIVTIAGPVSVQ